MQRTVHLLRLGLLLLAWTARTAHAAGTIVPIIEIIDTRVPAIASAGVGVVVHGKPVSYSPTGTLTLKEGNNVLRASSTAFGGIFVIVVPLSPGPHVLTAFYSGDANYLPGQSSPATVQAIAATVTLSAAGPAGLAFGIRATVLGAGRCVGTVTLVEGGKTLATKAIDVPSGTAEFLSSSYPQLTNGQHTITASFADTSGACGPATASPFSVYIGVPTSVTEITSITPNPSRFGQLPQATIRVTAAAGIASGRVAVKQGAVGLAIGDLDATGLARLSLPSLPVGSWPVTAEYAGSSTTMASVSAPVTMVIKPAVIFLSAAGGQNALAPGSLASAYGSDLAPISISATTNPLPTNLGGVDVSVPCEDGTTRKAQLSYVSPQQINFVVPPESKVGAVGIQISSAGQSLFGDASIEKVAPSIFTADGAVPGVPVGVLVTVHADGSQESRLAYECSGGTCRASELELPAETTNVLVLYATGVRNAKLEDVIARAANVDLPVQYAGAQPDYAGLDQINLLVPPSMAGRGTVTLEIAVGGKFANAVSLRFR